MFVIINVVAQAPGSHTIGGATIGATVALCALFAGPFTGASMNPARSLGPALVAGRVADLWIHWTAPFAGAALAISWCRLARGAACCSRARA